MKSSGLFFWAVVFCSTAMCTHIVRQSRTVHSDERSATNITGLVSGTNEYKAHTNMPPGFLLERCGDTHRVVREVSGRIVPFSLGTKKFAVEWAWDQYKYEQKEATQVWERVME